jgi:hypothetical protein
MSKKNALNEAARKILAKESNDPTPDRDAHLSTPNKETLHPNSGSVPQEPSPLGNSAEQLNAEPPKSLDDGPDKSQNLGAKASGDLSKDKSKPASTGGAPESFGLKEDEYEISEELEAFIAEKVAAGLTEDEIAAAIAENFELVEDDETEEDKSKIEEAAAAAVAKNKEKLKEHVDALLEGETLSEEFRDKATTIFEAAVTERLSAEVAVLEEAYNTALDEKVKELSEGLEAKVEDFLTAVVEQWVIENQVALDSGLRNELTEEFINGLRTLFQEHYIDVPEDKVDVVEQLGKDVEDLKGKLNEEIARNVELSKTINEAKRAETVNAMCEGLTVTQAEKLKTLSEGVEFGTLEAFTGKIKTLKESYFPAVAPKNDTVIDNEPTAQPKGQVLTEGNTRMDRYVKTLGKSRPKN